MADSRIRKVRRSDEHGSTAAAAGRFSLARESPSGVFHSPGTGMSSILLSINFCLPLDPDLEHEYTANYLFLVLNHTFCVWQIAGRQSFAGVCVHM
jgi:hypothetical protein